MKASEVIDKYITFFEKRGHTRIENSSLVPLNDPTTLFTSSGMQPLVPYLLGEPHSAGKRLVNVQNSFRAQDIDEVGDNRHTTFFRMLGNWSLGDYFKSEQIPWFFEFLTNDLALDPNRLYVSVFEGDKTIPRDEESAKIWRELFETKNISFEGRIFFCGVGDNWWSRAGTPENMPPGELGGPDTEVYYDLMPDAGKVEGTFKELSDNGRLLEIGNSVFMQYQKQEDGTFKELPQRNVDFGGGLERLVSVTEGKTDIFETSLFAPIISSIESSTGKKYSSNKKEMRIVADHLTAAIFITSNGVVPSNKEQGYILRRLIRRALDNLQLLGGEDPGEIIETIVESYKTTDPDLVEKYEPIKNTILEEGQAYERARKTAKKNIDKELEKRGIKKGDDLLGTVEIPADLAFKSLASYGLGPTQFESLGYSFDRQALAEEIKKHQDLSRAGAKQKFAGGLADHSERTIQGHTATHLMHQALRDMFGTGLHQTGSNITEERVRFDFNFDRKLTEDEIKQLEKIVNKKIQENLPVHFEMMPVARAKELGAIGLFDEKYAKDVKVYFIGEYSREFCGGPHVHFTGEVKSYTISKQESLGRGQQRLYSTVG